LPSSETIEIFSHLAPVILYGIVVNYLCLSRSQSDLACIIWNSSSADTRKLVEWSLGNKKTLILGSYRRLK
jgi:hypothetical protein